MNYKNFISTFISRQGLYVLSSSFYTKAISFITTIAIIHILSKSEYGLVSYAVTILAFILPFTGAGLYQGLLRYGSLSKSQSDKKLLFKSLFAPGLKWSIYITIGVILLSPILSERLPKTLIYIIILSLQIVSLYLLQMILVYCRLIHNNKLFSLINLQNYTLLLVFNIIGAYALGAIGFVCSMIVVPFLLSLYYLKKLNLFSMSSITPEDYFLNKDYNLKDVFSYGLHMSIGGVLSQLLFAIDILLIGNIIADSEQLAQYKTSSIIPFSLMILGSSVLATDFVKLANASKANVKYLMDYYKSYLQIFFFVSIPIVLIFYFFSSELLLLFGPEYQEDQSLMFIFSLGLAGALLFRIPMGNMLSAIGWPKTNTVLSLIILIMNIIVGYFMVVKYGLTGAAITTSVLIWVSGIFSLFAFLVFYNRTEKTV